MGAGAGGGGGLLILDREDVEVGYEQKSKKAVLHVIFFSNLDPLRGHLR